MIESYPLSWPDGWKRIPSGQREFGRFAKGEKQNSTVPGVSGWTRYRDLTVADALERLLGELGRMGITRDEVIISTNVPTRLDGLPKSNAPEPSDPGAAVYWRVNPKETRCMAIDRYTRVADNIAALAATLDAMRSIERHGGAEILNRAFKGFAALTEKAGQGWRAVFGFPPEQKVTAADVEKVFRELARQHHPDQGGDVEKFHEVIAARDAAKFDVEGLR